MCLCALQAIRCGGSKRGLKEHGFFVTFNACDRQTFESVPKHIEKITQECMRPATIVVLACQCDGNREVPTCEAKQWMKDHRQAAGVRGVALMGYVETSAVSGHNVELAMDLILHAHPVAHERKDLLDLVTRSLQREAVKNCRFSDIAHEAMALLCVHRFGDVPLSTIPMEVLVEILHINDVLLRRWMCFCDCIATRAGRKCAIC